MFDDIFVFIHLEIDGSYECCKVTSFIRLTERIYVTDCSWVLQSCSSDDITWTAMLTWNNNSCLTTDCVNLPCNRDAPEHWAQHDWPRHQPSRAHAVAPRWKRVWRTREELQRRILARSCGKQEGFLTRGMFVGAGIPNMSHRFSEFVIMAWNNGGGPCQWFDPRIGALFKYLCKALQVHLRLENLRGQNHFLAKTGRRGGSECAGY